MSFLPEACFANRQRFTGGEESTLMMLGRPFGRRLPQGDMPERLLKKFVNDYAEKRKR
jgi:hypothetical protein